MKNSLADAIYNSSTDPYFNLAAEQYLLEREDPRPVFMLWRNDRAVIIGRNQNAFAEIDESFVRENNIPVVRRLTGGGAVFHDLGNVNFTFIENRETGGGLDFPSFVAPVAEALRALGVDAVLTGRNDIEVAGLKVSGNAQCRRGTRVMHHGTLLWSANLSGLAGALRPDPDKIASKGIKSVRSRVGNLRALTGSDMSVTDFIDYLFAAIHPCPRGFTAQETECIRRLRGERYATWEWNLGRSREYSRHVKKRFPYGTVELCFDSEYGRISAAAFKGDFFGAEDTEELAAGLRGVRLEYAELAAALRGVGSYISGASAEDIAQMFLL